MYQDNSCPLCRMSIPVTPPPMQSSHDLTTGSGGLSDVNIATTRHRAHFQLRNRRNPPGYVNVACTCTFTFMLINLVYKYAYLPACQTTDQN